MQLPYLVHTLVLWWSSAYVGSEIFFGGHTVRRLLVCSTTLVVCMFIIVVIHVCFPLFLLSWALHSPTSRNSLFQP